MPGPWSRRPRPRPDRRSARLDRDHAVGRRVSSGVVEQVDQTCRSSSGSTLTAGSDAGTIESTRCVPNVGSIALTASRTNSCDRRGRAVHGEDARLDSRDVEQIGHESRETVGLDFDEADIVRRSWSWKATPTRLESVEDATLIVASGVRKSWETAPIRLGETGRPLRGVSSEGPVRGVGRVPAPGRRHWRRCSRRHGRSSTSADLGARESRRRRPDADSAIVRSSPVDAASRADADWLTRSGDRVGRSSSSRERIAGRRRRPSTRPRRARAVRRPEWRRRSWTAETMVSRSSSTGWSPTRCSESSERWSRASPPRWASTRAASRLATTLATSNMTMT